jgi:BirA family biotin operon repressor/biotin-[acetyl-CoA-carboxylase] ligase
LVVFDEVASTNDLASDYPDTTAVLSRHQTAGRGQYGRQWASRPNDSMLLSVKLAPPPDLRRPVLLTALAVVSVADAVRELCGLDAAVKWPNDLLVGGRKVCGVLIEQAVGVVVGIGLNLNQDAEAFRAAGLPTATSLFLETGRNFEPLAAAEAVLDRLDREFARLAAGVTLPLEAAWATRLGLSGKPVRGTLLGGTVFAGTLKGVGFESVLLLTDAGPAGFQPERIRRQEAAG